MVLAWDDSEDRAERCYVIRRMGHSGHEEDNVEKRLKLGAVDELDEVVFKEERMRITGCEWSVRLEFLAVEVFSDRLVVRASVTRERLKAPVKKSMLSIN